MHRPKQLPHSSSPVTLLRALCLALTGLLAYAGQRRFMLEHGQQLPVSGVLLLLAAVVLLGTLVFTTNLRPPAARLRHGIGGNANRLVISHGRIVCGLLAVGLSLVAMVMGQQPHRGWYALTAWLISCVCALLAAYTRGPAMHWRGWLRAHGLEAGLVLACVLVALMVRTVDLATIPRIVTGDEGSIGLEARDILSGRNDPAFVVGWAGLPRLTFLLMALPMKLWGQGIVGLRMHAALTGTATILTLYWLVRPQGGMWLAQCSSWLLATYPYHIHVSRLGVNQADDSLLLTLTFAAFFWGVRRGKPLGWALTGLCGALSLGVYPGARLAIVLVVGLAGVLALVTRGRWLIEQRQGLLIALAVFVVTGLPMLRYYVSHWSAFNTRLNEVGIIQSGWLAREVQRSGRSAPAIIGSQFLRTCFAYGFYGDTSGFYGDPAGLLQFWPAVLFPLGLAISIFWIRRPFFLLWVLWFFGVVILGGTLTLSPPYSTRLSGFAPVFVVMIALALVTLAELGNRLVRWKQSWAVAGTAVLVAALGISGIHYYFVDYTPHPWFGDLNAELATEASSYLNKLPPQAQAYFLGLPRMFYSFSTIPFLAPEVPGSDAPEKLTGLPANFDPRRPAFFFSIPQREAELRLIQQQVPGGRWIELRRVVDHAPLLYAYEVDQPAAGALGFRHLKKIYGPSAGGGAR